MKQIVRFPRFADQEGGASTKAIERLIHKLNKKYEKNENKGLSVLSESVFSAPRVYISSGILPIDCVVGYGLGFPAGIVEIFGPEASGKSAVLEHTLAEAQRRGYFTGLFPMEYSIDIRRAVAVGIDPKKLIIYDAETIEDVYDQIKDSVKKIREMDKQTPIVLGWDTIAATPTRSEMEHKGGLEASDMGRSALQMSKLFRRLVRFLFINQVCLLCINQTRTNLAQMWGSKETTFGGKALKFYAWVRCRIRQAKTIKDGDGKEIGIMCEMRVVKNKVAPPLRECKIPIYWEKGIDPIRAIWEFGIDTEVFRRRGSVYKFHGHILTGKKFGKFYRNHREEINEEIRQAFQGQGEKR